MSSPREMTYDVWYAMRQRCQNPSNESFPHYGGRGIRICERWQCFGNFLADMGEKPQGLSIDRIENDGDYSPENCRWSDRYAQNNNTRSNRFIEYAGERRTLAQWARVVGLSKSTLKNRLNDGWPVSKALFAPLVPGISGAARKEFLK